MAAKRKLKILIIDSDSEQAEQLVKFVEEEGHTPVLLTRGTQVGNRLRHEQFHIIIMEWKLPDHDGLEVMREIRKFDSDICVIILTAAPSIESAIVLFKMRAFDYLKKPFKPAELHQTLERAIIEQGLITDLAKRANVQVGERLKKLRLEKDLTLRQIASRVGLSVSLISQIERAESSASLQTLARLASALNTKLEYLFQGL